MLSPFPGMNPFLEHPSLWPDFHNTLIIAIRDELAGRLAPDYFVKLGRRIFLLQTDDEVSENYLEIHEVETGELVTVLELLSPANKLHDLGREKYERKRDQIFRSRTNLIEIDLLRAGEPMMVVGRTVQSDYRILVSRGTERPRARQFAFNLRQPIPAFHIPLLPGDEEPLLDLGRVLHDLYDRARFDLRLNYEKAAVPPLSEEDAAWAHEQIGRPSAPKQS
ncbi:MAG: DUF4058 family protein [Candidatus Promineifilaceae bacterium]